jgi:Ethylene-responsive protein kinase Le-CTR1
MDSSPAKQEAGTSNVFHRDFDATGLKPDERLVVLICATDGAVVSVNGHEIGRINMPDGTIDAKALATQAPKDDGLFDRIRVPAEFIHTGKNTIDADVHSSVAGGSPLSCDLEIKTLPSLQNQPAPDDAAKKVLELFRKTSYLPAGTLIPDGYIDGGHGMHLDSSDHATSGREILVVDRPLDPELQKDLAYARSLKNLAPVDRAHKLSLYVDQLTTPPGGRKALGDTVDELQEEFVNKPLCIGDVVNQYHAGVCRHRSLLFKILADEAGLKIALVRGNYFHSGKGDPHAWNELLLEDGRRYLVDTTQHPKDIFPEITTPQVTSASVASHYVKLDNTPYYKSSKG